jgi:GNAT superfamily N-acetyltransferase
MGMRNAAARRGRRILLQRESILVLARRSQRTEAGVRTESALLLLNVRHALGIRGIGAPSCDGQRRRLHLSSDRDDDAFLRGARQHVHESIASNIYSIVRWQGDDIGALAVRREPTHIQLDQMFILPSHQNQGVGTHLIRRLAQEAKTAAKPLRLRVLSVNPARRLYEREGFVVTSVTPERIFMERHA